MSFGPFHELCSIVKVNVEGREEEGKGGVLVLVATSLYFNLPLVKYIKFKGKKTYLGSRCDCTSRALFLSSPPFSLLSCLLPVPPS